MKGFLHSMRKSYLIIRATLKWEKKLPEELVNFVMFASVQAEVGVVGHLLEWLPYLCQRLGKLPKLLFYR